MPNWTLDQARHLLVDAKLRLPGWYLALHGSVLYADEGRDLDLLVIPGGPLDDLPAAFDATEIITSRPDKLRFLLPTGRCIDAKIVSVWRSEDA